MSEGVFIAGEEMFVAVAGWAREGFPRGRRAGIAADALVNLYGSFDLCGLTV